MTAYDCAEKTESTQKASGRRRGERPSIHCEGESRRFRRCGGDDAPPRNCTSCRGASHLAFHLRHPTQPRLSPEPHPRCSPAPPPSPRSIPLQPPQFRTSGRPPRANPSAPSRPPSRGFCSASQTSYAARLGTLVGVPVRRQGGRPAARLRHQR